MNLEKLQEETKIFKEWLGLITDTASIYKVR